MYIIMYIYKTDSNTENERHFERNQLKENSRKVLGSSTSMSTDEELALSNLVSDRNESIQTSMDDSCRTDEFTDSF